MFERTIRLSILLLLLLFTRASNAQLISDSISETDVAAMLRYLASDSLKGRGDYTPELYVAAHFIEQKFKDFGLKRVLPTFLQPFTTKKLSGNEVLKDTAGNYNPLLR